MKKLLLLMVLLLSFSMAMNAQKAVVEGVVTDVTGNPVQGVAVTSGTASASTDATGKFEISGLDMGKIILIFTHTGFETQQLSLNVDAARVKAGYIQLKSSENVSGDNVSETSLTNIESEDEVKDQYVSGLLHSSNDAFISISSYTLSAGYFRPRGYDNEYSEVMIGGLALNDPETGRPNYSDWGGLNDATRYKESAYGLTPTRFSFGTIAGTSDIDVRPSHQRKQTKFSYAFSNRTYRHRAMLTYNTGMMKNNWAITASVSTRQGNGGYVEGTFYDAYSYFLSIEKKFNKKHSLVFTGFGAPAKRGMQAAAVQEIYDMLGDNYYNPNWGYQNGEVRNSKIRNSHEPVLLLSHYYDINDKTKLTTTLGYSFGRTGTTALNWYNSADPRPDYYRYLPSWQENMYQDTPANPDVVNSIISGWQNDANVRQINWDELYYVNYLSALEGKQSRYVVEERRLDHSQIGLASHINYEMNKHSFISGGLNVNIYKSRNYKVMNDMLDGNGYEGFWIDVDQYTLRDFPTDSAMAQNDLNNPNKVIKKGDVFGYDYDVHINTGNLWGLGEFTYNHFDFYVGLKLSGTQFWRVGNMQNGRYPEDSYGKSAKHSFFDYAVKAGATYKLSGRHYFVLNLSYMTMAPSFSDVYLAPRVRNSVLPDIQTRKIFSGDLSYIIRYPKFNMRITAFNTNFDNDTKVLYYYFDTQTGDGETLVNYFVTGIKKVHQGIEVGAEVKLIPDLSLMLGGSIGNYRITNQPTGFITSESGIMPDSVQKIYCKNFYVSGTPQMAGSLGLKYNKNYWYVNLNANLFANNWVDFAPNHRTVEVFNNTGIYEGDERLTLVTQQIKGYDNPQFTLDASISKSWKVDKNMFLGINASVTNIFNNTKLVTNGYEQARIDINNYGINAFAPKYYYGYGRTFFLMASLKF